MKSQLDQFIIDHISYELGSLSEYDIFESHGYYDNISYIVEKIHDKIRSNILSLKDGETFETTLSDMSIFNRDKVFFDEYSLSIEVTYKETEKELNRNLSGGSYFEDSQITMENGIIEFYPIMEIHATGSSKMKIMNFILKDIGHEFLHAYNDYCVFKESKGESRLKDIYFKYNYKTSETSTLKTEVLVSQILYFTDQAEKNARVAQIKQEIEQYKNGRWKQIDIKNAVDSTEINHDIQDAENKLYELMDRSYGNDKEADDNKYYTIEAVKGLSGYNFSTFEQAIRFLKNKIYKVRKQFNKQAYKIATDVYLENNNKWL